MKNAKECDCIVKMDKLLAEHNTQIVAGTVMEKHPKREYVFRSRALVVSEAVAKIRGKKAVRVVATHCPFCGVKYPEYE